jgi:hypothetical protein
MIFQTDTAVTAEPTVWRCLIHGNQAVGGESTGTKKSSEFETTRRMGAPRKETP